MLEVKVFVLELVTVDADLALAVTLQNAVVQFLSLMAA